MSHFTHHLGYTLGGAGVGFAMAATIYAGPDATPVVAFGTGAVAVVVGGVMVGAGAGDT